MLVGDTCSQPVAGVVVDPAVGVLSIELAADAVDSGPDDPGGDPADANRLVCPRMRTLSRAMSNAALDPDWRQAAGDSDWR